MSESNSESNNYRRLSPEKLVESVDKMAKQIEGDFAESGLSKVAKQIAVETRETIVLGKELIRPLWLLRIGCGILIILALVWPLILAPFLKFKETFTSLADFMEATDAGLHMIIVIGAGIVFLVTLEARIKRNKALHSLAELRSLAHIIDMHQITKDPGVDTRKVRKQRTVNSDAELAVYLDHASDLLSILGKLAAYHVQDINDRVVLDAVNEIETLTNALSRKLWQKVMIINHIADAQERVVCK